MFDEPAYTHMYITIGGLSITGATAIVSRRHSEYDDGAFHDAATGIMRHNDACTLAHTMQSPSM